MVVDEQLMEGPATLQVADKSRLLTSVSEIALVFGTPFTVGRNELDICKFRPC
jgi:hypothetical protein